MKQIEEQSCNCTYKFGNTKVHIVEPEITEEENSIFMNRINGIIAVIAEELIKENK